MFQELKTLQLFYSAVLADSVKNYHEAGILEEITNSKQLVQAQTATAQLHQLNINSSRELFEKFSLIFGCIDWKISENSEVLIAEGSGCKLCAIAKKIGTVQPCNIYCINPFKEFIKVLEHKRKLNVINTLWNDDKCVFKVE